MRASSDTRGKEAVGGGCGAAAACRRQRVPALEEVMRMKSIDSNRWLGKCVRMWAAACVCVLACATLTLSPCALAEEGAQGTGQEFADGRAQIELVYEVEGGPEQVTIDKGAPGSSGAPSDANTMARMAQTKSFGMPRTGDPGILPAVLVAACAACSVSLGFALKERRCSDE